jgi:ABC-2 type transport system ATP-binding protein
MSKSNTPTIFAEGLYKSYGTIQALAGIDLAVKQGTVLGLLGPNGAGKTTAVRILTTQLRPDAGHAVVAGYDVVTQARQLRAHIGLAGQNAAVDDRLTGFENLDMIGRLYHLPIKTTRDRAHDLLERFDLIDVADRVVKTYSGGMRRRLDLAASLIISPQVLFLDEPTAGLDPLSRQGMWEIIATLVANGTTVLLTTQYLEEADQLADAIVVVDRGYVIAQGSPDKLKAQIGGERLRVTIARGDQLARVAELLRPYAMGEAHINAERRTISLPVSQGTEHLAAIIRDLDIAQILITDLALHRPTLDDVFLTLTGHTAKVDAPREKKRSQREEPQLVRSDI